MGFFNEILRINNHYRRDSIPFLAKLYWSEKCRYRAIERCWKILFIDRFCAARRALEIFSGFIALFNFFVRFLAVLKILNRFRNTTGSLTLIQHFAGQNNRPKSRP